MNQQTRSGNDRLRSFAVSAMATAALLLAPVVSQAAVDITANQKGQLTSVGNGLTRTFHQYDSQGREVATQYVQDGQSRVFSTTYGYPQNPQPTGPGTVVLTQTFPDGEQVLYTYDLAAMQMAVRSKIGSVTEDIVRDVRKNARGQLTRIELGNAVVTTFVYDETGNLLLIRSTAVNAAGQTIQDYTYNYDKNGNVTGTSDGVRTDQSATLEYDSLDQLIAFRNSVGNVIELYDYDEIGNLRQKGALIQSYGAGGRPHALASSGGIAYGYDANGNVTSIGSTTNIEWNAENMSKRVTAGPAVTDKSFLGESLWKKVEQGVTTYYLPAMRVENGVARKYYGSFAERLEQPGDRQLRFYHPDHLGSSSVMSDQSGTVIRRASYFPWGQDRGVEGTFTPKLQFNFKEKDASGLYDYGARMYNAVTGRWLSPDNTLADGLNRYAYARNNPWTRVDPTGHDSDHYWAICPATQCRGLVSLYVWYDESNGPLPDGWSKVDLSSGAAVFWKEGTARLHRLLSNGTVEESVGGSNFWMNIGRPGEYNATRDRMENAVELGNPPQGPGYGEQVALAVGRDNINGRLYWAFEAEKLVAQVELAVFTGPTGGAGTMTSLNIAEGIGYTGVAAGTVPKALALGSLANATKAVAEGAGTVARFSVKEFTWSRNVEALKYAAEHGIPITVSAGRYWTKREIVWMIIHGVQYARVP